MLDLVKRHLSRDDCYQPCWMRLVERKLNQVFANILKAVEVTEELINMSGTIQRMGKVRDEKVERDSRWFHEKAHQNWSWR